MLKRLLYLGLALLATIAWFPPRSEAASLTLHWRSSPNPVAGYTVWHGPVEAVWSGQSEFYFQLNRSDLGDVTTTTIGELAENIEYIFFVTSRAQDGSLSEPSNFAAYIFSTNHPPALDPIPDQNASADHLLTFTASGADSDAGQKVQYLLGPNSPDGSSIDPATGVFFWIPEATLPEGDYPVSVIVIDTGKPSYSAQQALTIHLAAPPPPPPPPTNFSLAVQPEGPGSAQVFPPSDNHIYSAGSTVDIFAYPNADALFLHWLVNGTDVITNNPVSLVMDADQTVIPKFGAAPEGLFFLTVQNDPIQGSIDITPPANNNLYSSGTNVQLLAVEKPGYIFLNWLVDQTILLGDNPLTLTMDKNHSVAPQYLGTPEAYFSLDLQPDPSGAVQASATSPNNKFLSGTVIELTAVPNPGFVFFYWLLDDATILGDNPLSILMDKNYKVSPAFLQAAQVYFSLALQSTNAGSVLVTPTSPDNRFLSGTSIRFTAAPKVGFQFLNWLVDQTNVVAGNPLNLTMNADHSVAPIFAEILYTLNLQSTTNGSVLVSPAAPGNKYRAGSAVQLNATPNAGFKFARWTIDQTNLVASNPISLPMDRNRDVTPVFTPIVYSLTVQPQTSGTVQLNPTTSDGKYPAGSSVQLTATPRVAFNFSNWLVDQTNSVADNPLTLLMNTNRVVTPIFVERPITYYLLTLEAQTNGSVQVVPFAADNRYAAGSSVQLTATPNPGFKFDCWRVDQTNIVKANPMTLPMDRNRALFPVFVESAYFTLTIPAQTAGRVQLTPLPTDGKYLDGTSVQLDAIPNNGCVFLNWLVDGATNTNTALTLTMNQSHTAAPNFAGAPIHIQFTAGGSVVTIPGGDAWILQISTNLSNWLDATNGAGSKQVFDFQSAAKKYFRVLQGTNSP